MARFRTANFLHPRELCVVLLIAGFCLLGPQILRASEPSPIAWTWTGGVTDQTAVMTTHVRNLDADISLEVQGPGEIQRLAPILAEPMENGRLLRFEISGLTAATDYAYRLVDQDGVPLDSYRRSFRTFPVPGIPTSFRFALGACARESNSPVFRAAIQQGAAFFLHTGDFHYADIKRNRIRLFRDAFDAHLSAPSLRTMLEKIPLIYQWDDHDFGPNNSNRNSPSREMSRTNYRQLVPHYPLVFGAAGPTDQAFTVGRVRFLLSDLRSERNPNTRRMMSEDQDAWLKAELLHAKGKYPLIFWISSVPWNGEPNTSDRWQGYGRHRAEIAQFIKANGIPGVCILAGDAHMVAIDDGSNSDFAEGGGAPIRVFQAAPIANRGSYKGGPYSHGARAEGPERMLYQFGLVDVQDDGHTIQVAWSARNGSDGFGARVVTATKWGSGPIELTFSVQ